MKQRRCSPQRAPESSNGKWSLSRLSIMTRVICTTSYIVSMCGSREICVNQDNTRADCASFCDLFPREVALFWIIGKECKDDIRERRLPDSDSIVKVLGPRSLRILRDLRKSDVNRFSHMRNLYCSHENEVFMHSRIS